MEEKEIIAKIKLLKEIKPQKDWVFLTKEKIFSQKQEPLKFPFGLKEILNLKIRFALALILILIFASFFGYLNLKNIANFTSLFEQNIFPQKEISKDILPLLENLDQRLAKISQSLSNLKINQDPREILATAGAVKYTAKRVQKTTYFLLKEGKLGEKETQVLASLGDLSQNLIQESEKRQKEVILALIKELEGKSLNQEDALRLKSAKEAFEKGDYEKAQVLVMRIYNSF